VKIVRALRALVPALALAALVVAPAGAEGSRQVLAYYYAWWDDSDDPNVIADHIGQARYAGIDGFVVSWYGHGDRTDTNLQKILDQGFRATVHVEVPIFWGVDDTILHLQMLYGTKLGHPGFVRYGGQPVIFFWRAARFDNATWSFIRSAVDPDRQALWLADGDNFAFLAGDAWDGISPYTAAWSANPEGTFATWAARARAAGPGKLWVPPVSPGCDDSPARPVTCLRARAGGQYYQRSWAGAAATAPEMVIVSTFNEWMENTDVQRRDEWGNMYLDLTRAAADLYKSS
jgi:hypothetical protein